MILDYYMTKRAANQRQKILWWLQKQMPAGNEDEVNAALAKVQELRNKIKMTIDQARQFPGSGPVKIGAVQSLVVPDTRYILSYIIPKRRRRVTVLSIRDGSRKPLKW